MSLINDALKRVKAAQQQAPPTASLVPQFKPVEPAPARQAGGNLWLPAIATLVSLLALVLVWQLRKQGSSAEPTPVKANTPHVDRTPANPEATRTAETPAGNPSLDLPSRSDTRPAAATTVAPVSNPQAGTRINPSAGATPVRTLDPGKSQTASLRKPTSSATPGSPIQAHDQLAPLAPTRTQETNQPTVSASSSNAQPATETAPTPPPPLKLQGIVFNPKRPSAVISGRTVFLGDRVREMRVVAISAESLTLVGAGRTNVLSLAE
jgi:hypothetical protein